jgi:hypothetical protein
MVENRSVAEESLLKLQALIHDNAEANELLQKLMDSLDFGLTFELVKNKIREITASTDQITMSLQVQDITAQQLAAVNHLIISVQHKLNGLLDAVDSNGLGESENIKMDKLPGVHFDANASYNPNENAQGNVDNVVNSEKASQEEIDKLFS